MAYRIARTCVGCGICKVICPVGAISGKPEHVYHIDPAVCIGCGACGRKCPHKSILDKNGKLARRIRLRKHWPKPVFDLDICTACRSCIEVCPVSCLERQPATGNRDTIRFPALKNPRACIACGFCERDCPVDAITLQLMVQ